MNAKDTPRPDRLAETALVASAVLFLAATGIWFAGARTTRLGGANFGLRVAPETLFFGEPFEQDGFAWTIPIKNDADELRRIVGFETSSGDGETMISTSYEPTAREWRLKDGSELAVLQHAGRVRFALFALESRILTISETTGAEAAKPGRRSDMASWQCRWSVFHWPGAGATPKLLGQGGLGHVMSVDILGNDAFLVDQGIKESRAKSGRSTGRYTVSGCWHAGPGQRPSDAGDHVVRGEPGSAQPATAR